MKDYTRNLSIATALVALLAAPALAHETRHYDDRAHPRASYHYPAETRRWKPNANRHYGKHHRTNLRRLYQAHARWHRHNDHRRGRWFHREHQRLHRSLGIDHWYFVHLGWRSPVRYYAYRW